MVPDTKCGTYQEKVSEGSVRQLANIEAELVLKVLAEKKKKKTIWADAEEEVAEGLEELEPFDNNDKGQWYLQTKRGRVPIEEGDVRLSGKSPSSSRTRSRSRTRKEIINGENVAPSTLSQ